MCTDIQRLSKTIKEDPHLSSSNLDTKMESKLGGLQRVIDAIEKAKREKDIGQVSELLMEGRTLLDEPELIESINKAKGFFGEEVAAKRRKKAVAKAAAGQA